MEALIPIPWAHVIFGERAMLRAAEMIYDLPEYVPRHWDLDEHGHKKSNKWRAWTTLDEPGYINKLDVAEFRRLVRDAGFLRNGSGNRSSTSCTRTVSAIWSCGTRI